MAMKIYIPRHFPDNLAYVFTIFMVVYMSLLQLLFMLPLYYGPQDALFWLHVSLGLFILYNVVGNLYHLIHVDSSIRGVYLNPGGAAGWRFCSVCESQCPPRSYHCFQCGVCVLKRDHHCTFTGSCVGFRNHRYYLLTTFYFSSAAAYAAYFNTSYVAQALGGWGVRPVLRMLLPVLSFLIGETSLLQTVLALTNVACIGGGLLLVCLTYFHWVLLAARNATVFERAKRITDFDLGWRANLRQVFGDRWLAAVMSPWSESPLPIDGISFPMRGGRQEMYKSQ